MAMQPLPASALLTADAPLDVREREYSPSSCIGGDYSGEIRAYEDLSAAAARAHPHTKGLAYGHGPTRTLDLFLPANSSAAADGVLPALLVYIHGGYWQELSKESALFAAPGALAADHAFAAIDYTLAPSATVREIALECRAALRWLHANAARLGFDAARISVAGSSAGGHLAALCCLRDWSEDADLPEGLPAAAVMVSGIYEVAPLTGTSIDEALGFSADAVALVSPLRWGVEGFPPSCISWGEIETGESKQQSLAFAAALRAAGVQVDAFEMRGRNHFDVIQDLTNSATPLGRATLALISTS